MIMIAIKHVTTLQKQKDQQKHTQQKENIERGKTTKQATSNQHKQQSATCTKTVQTGKTTNSAETWFGASVLQTESV